MADTAHRRWTLEEYLAWEADQPTRNEFIDGRPRAMVGGTNAHNRISGNVFSFLHGRLAGGRCIPYTMNTKVMIPNGNVRYPDVLVDCGPFRANDIAAVEPSVVIEIYSKSTTKIDRTEKLDAYRLVPTIRHILHLHQDEAKGVLWSREESGWKETALEGPRAKAHFAAIEVRMPFSAAYAGMPLGGESGDA
ncbi:MAG: Uma2 family endonuclease [Hyphomonadaceae bacterium]|nr:Uma2 family endonuclease [Hyphomonadaceae bacterium]